MKTSVFLTLTFSLIILLGYSQKTISGIVESEEGKAIPFATIQVDQSQNGTISDIQGKFKIENITIR